MYVCITLESQLSTQFNVHTCSSLYISDLVVRFMFRLFICLSNASIFRTNIPKEIMPFPDFPFHETEASFVHHTDVLKYLKKYAQCYDLNKHIRVSLSWFKLSLCWVICLETILTKTYFVDIFPHRKVSIYFLCVFLISLANLRPFCLAISLYLAT